MDVSVLGTGIMGRGMAESLLRAGHRVRVWNRTADKTVPLVEAGATAATDPSEAVAGAEIVVTMLFDEAATAAVIERAAGAMAGAVWVQTATVGPEGAARLGQLAARHELPTLDAPVLGTKKPAAEGALVVLASGDPALRSRVEPVLDAISSKVVWAGDRLGAASALKLACNAWVLSITAATAQSIALARRLEVDPQLFLDAVAGGPTDSPYAQLKGRAMLAGAYEPSFEVDGALKDLGLITGAAQKSGVNPSVVAAVRDMFRATSEAGHGAEDIAAVYEAVSVRE